MSQLWNRNQFDHSWHTYCAAPTTSSQRTITPNAMSVRESPTANGLAGSAPVPRKRPRPNRTKRKVCDGGLVRTSLRQPG